NFLNWKDKLPTGIELITEPLAVSAIHPADETEDQTTKLKDAEPLSTERNDKKDSAEPDESEYNKQLATAEDLTYDKPKRKLTPKVLTKQIDSSALPQHTSSKA
ncbi:hypothetical protein, partial [Salmonella sp. s51228]|uniref:hypothetical protein n=1 Tax=Salmonella sp. s51228 TaxID=3159652 RepID=UPI00398148AC